MGLVTVFSIEGCPFCKKAKGILEQHGIPFLEISLTDYPQKRGEMVKLTKSLTVPQVFFQDKHVGGADKVSALEESGELDKMWDEIKDLGDPKNIGVFSIPDTPPAPKPVASERKVEEFGDKKLVEMVRWIESKFGRSNFQGKALVSAIEEEFKCGSRDEAVALGKATYDAGVVVVVSREKYEEGQFSDNDTSYCLYKSKNVAALNNTRVWKDRVDPAMVTVKVLKSKLTKILSKYTDAEGLVDYAAASKDADFLEFDEATCEFQSIDLAAMEPNERLAFSINLYNVMTKHAFTKVGIPDSDLQRMDFFDHIGYEIGGNFFSFNALENGVLRTNKVPPYHMSKTIPSGDPREKAIMPVLDHRIHFALNCGARSCPPVKNFTAEAIQEELDVVSQAFFEQPENCTIEGNTITLTKIIQWYKSDFGSSKEEVARAVSRYLVGEKAKIMQALLKKSKFSIKFGHYDWSTDSKNALPYRKISKCVIQ